MITSTAYQGYAFNSIANLTRILTETERITNTPLSIAYSISISQITWVYVLALPFQLYSSLGWITIPGTIAAAYIILGLAAIGREIENPFGDGVNDLPLDAYCRELAADIDILVSKPLPRPEEFVFTPGNRVFNRWAEASMEDIRKALKAKAEYRGSLKLEERDVEVRMEVWTKSRILRRYEFLYVIQMRCNIQGSIDGAAFDEMDVLCQKVDVPLAMGLMSFDGCLRKVHRFKALRKNPTSLRSPQVEDLIGTWEVYYPAGKPEKSPEQSPQRAVFSEVLPKRRIQSFPCCRDELELPVSRDKLFAFIPPPPKSLSIGNEEQP